MPLLNRILSLACLAAVICGASIPCRAANPEIPNFWDTKERLNKPDLAELPRLRFLTTVDFPPFNFIDSSGRLSGFHIDLARAICRKLDVVVKCQIQALPWVELESALKRKDGEAIIAGIAVTADSRDQYAFSRTYLQFAARFVALKAKAPAEPLHETLKGAKVAVVAGSAHQKMLRDYFPEATAVPFQTQDEMLKAVKAGSVEAAFGDGMRLGFWLAGSESGDCCRFSGGPYLAPEYLGAGLAIAAAPDNAKLVAAFDYALHELNLDGTFAELYLRYFPVSFY